MVGSLFGFGQLHVVTPKSELSNSFDADSYGAVPSDAPERNLLTRVNSPKGASRL
jgi:hypothetical protein